MYRLTMATVLLCAAPAFAACDGVENALGVYFDQGSYAENCFEPVPTTPFTMYFVFQHGTLPDFHGIEFSWRFEPQPASAINYGYWWNCGTDLWDPYNVYLGCWPGLPVSEPLVVLSFSYMLLAPLSAPSFVRVGPPPAQSLPGHAAVAGGDPLQIIPLNFCDDWDGADVTIDADGWTVPGLAAIAPAGGCGAVAVVGATWGSIKALYREEKGGK
jgi:hypothetical protein